ncbi:hypothetical protein HNQ50_000517 [Silvimonas terrae]|uniref:THAP4-like heme-binding domain-containing protein n=1 Tax=Silvimonas terrae TaxID=300266 RepID=A0A840RA72_9NEIS|nr:heme-binding beta-barrel domain-containing protein [Silvimonas terrae]MBB5189807.1 hypothetical protein [Silvimonas terrae]
MKLHSIMLATALAAGAAGTIHAKEAANPLTALIGVWEGDKGTDVAPAQKSTGKAGTAAASPYFERMEIAAGPGVTNASEQDLVSVTIRQRVYRKSDKQQFHDQMGYLIWDQKNSRLIYSFCIPRGVCASAEGKYDKPGEFNLGTKSAFAETDFMKKNAKTNSVAITMKLAADGTLSYSEVTALTIYGKPFTHVDASTLKKVAGN